MPNSTEQKERNSVQESAELKSIVTRKEAINKGVKFYFILSVTIICF